MKIGALLSRKNKREESEVAERIERQSNPQDKNYMMLFNEISSKGSNTAGYEMDVYDECIKYALASSNYIVAEETLKVMSQEFSREFFIANSLHKYTTTERVIDAAKEGKVLLGVNNCHADIMLTTGMVSKISYYYEGKIVDKADTANN